MRATSERLKKDVKDTLADLRTLRDELKVQVHLAGMNARPRLEELENELEKLESAAKQATRVSVKTLKEGFLELKATLTACDSNTKASGGN